jgi:hypothetical protein
MARGKGKTGIAGDLFLTPNEAEGVNSEHHRPNFAINDIGRFSLKNH